MEPLDVELGEGELELPTDPMLMNMGPSHPAMHGTVRRKWPAHAQILRPQQSDPVRSDLPVLSTDASDAETGFSFLF